MADDELLIRKNITLLRQQLDKLMDKEDPDREIIQEVSCKLDLLITAFYNKKLTKNTLEHSHE